MTETLSVIDEHITDMHTPRQSYLALRPQMSKDSNSVYGSEPDRRVSYINGQETDEEEMHGHTESEVLQWSPTKVAEYLEDAGVEKPHCEVFCEQEISGEVLLAMEQSAIFIKEFELGSVGRRLKTWQKIKALQDEVRANNIHSMRQASVSEYSANGDESLGDIGRARSASTTASPYLGQSGRNIPGSRGSMQASQNGVSPSTTTSYSQRPDSLSRPSAQNIRTMNHSRRHSSIGSTASMNNLTSPTGITGHRKNPSMDRSWTMAGADATASRRSSQAYSLSGGAQPNVQSPDWTAEAGASRNDLDRGYFSGNEIDNKKGNRRSVLQKRSSASASHSRNLSGTMDANSSNASTPQPKMDSPLSPMMSGGPGFSKMRGIRSASTPKAFGKTVKTYEPPGSPIVTKLEYGQSPASPAFVGSESSSVAPSPSANTGAFSFFNKNKATGMRVVSDAVTSNEKAGVATQSPVMSPTRTGSTTPSTESKSIDMQKSEQSRMSTGSSQGLAPPTSTSAPKARPRVRSKKFTSAYTRGLEKKPPAEQIVGCDYSGWMKKKSSSIVGSWKPRLFVLHGRRLSYYYSENDKEEKGLIDISGHRVLPAENDKITGLHAQLAGAGSPNFSDNSSSLKTSAAADLAAKPILNPQSDSGLFLFKLVPPRQGLSKAVNFTKPVVHYFAVSSRQEGRLWMAALMKATIDYDSSGKVTTSYNQETISLAKARARKERPPALHEGEADPNATEMDAGSTNGSQKSVLRSQGLGIDGLDEQTDERADSTAGAENTRKAERDGLGLDSLAGSLKNKEAAAFIS